MTPGHESRQRAQRLGHRAEWLAAFALTLKGYRIVARRFKTPIGEIDLIARRGKLVAFVEVKARANMQMALDAVTPTSRQRIAKAANWWLSQQHDHGQLSSRFDVIAVCPRRWPVHLQNVWQGR